MKALVIGLEYRLSRNPQLLKRRLETAGPTYIKMGQFVANRPDIFGDELSGSLRSLQDGVTPVPWRDLGVQAPDGVEVLEPIAAASIAQVHLGKYRGRQVAIKARRPNVESQIRQDLSQMRFMFREKILVDFEDSLLKELDFKQELKNLQEFGQIYEGTNVIVPGVYPEVSSDDLLVMDYVPSTGKLVSAERLINLFIEQMLFEDVIHGDMHSGNIGTIGNSIVLYDFGNVIRTNKEYRMALRQFVQAIQSQDISKIIKTMRMMGMYVANEKVTRAFIKKLLRYLETVDIKEFRFAAGETQDRVPVVLDSVTAAIVRSFSLLEGYCKSVDPGFSYQEIIQRNLELLFLDLETRIPELTGLLGSILGSLERDR